MPTSNRKRYWLTLVSVLLLIIFTVVLYAQLSQSRLLNQTTEFHESNLSWRVFQLEREALEFRSELLLAQEPGSQEDGRQSLPGHFEVLWSRFNVLAQQSDTRAFLGREAVEPVLGEFGAFLNRMEPHFTDRKVQLSEQVIVDVRQALDHQLPGLRGLSNQAIRRAAELATLRSDNIRNQIRISTGLVLFQLLLTLVFFYLVIRLVRELKSSHDQLDALANFDVLTGLPNRRLFMDSLERDISKARRNGSRVALLFIDLDNFKDVNDSSGHAIGDELLKDTARRLRKAVRSSDTVSRLGGDEFTVVITDLERGELAAKISDNILHAIRQPFHHGSSKHYISASIGITIFPDDAQDGHALFKHADQAMYEAKRLGRNRYHYFIADMQLAAQRRLERIAELRTALQREQFFVTYQPIVDLGSGRVHKAEALIRWSHPELGIVRPDEFIPLLEETGLIVEVSDWLFATVSRQALEWRRRLDPQFQISLNTSPVQLRDNGTDFVRWIDLMAALELEGSAIAMEITEGILMDSAGSQRLLQMQGAGLEVSLDDFGTGYSTLSYLKKFNIDYLKIDKSFVQNLHPESSDYALCEAIIVMAHKLGIKVIAEGIETAQQRSHLAQMGCDYGQGYLFSRPVSAADFEICFEGLCSEA